MLRDIKILLVEDDEDDYLIAKEVLEDVQGDDLELDWVQDYNDGLSYLAQNDVSVCLVDYRIGAHTGLEFLEVAKSRGIRCPFILLTGVGQHDIDVAATQAGASDFLDKSALSPSLVERSIRYAIANAKAMEALAEQTSFLETTLEYSGAGIAALDANHVLTTCNNQFEDLMKKFADVHCGGGDDVRDDPVEHLLHQLNEAPDNELEFKDAAGRVFEIRQNQAPHGGLVIFAVDVTDQKAFEDHLIKAKAEVEAASRAKSSFLANMTHEFRTPLHGIMGFSDLIKKNAETDEIKEYVEQIIDSSAHLLEIINTVLAYSRLEAGQHPFEDSELLEVDCLLEFCIKQVKAAADEHQVGIIGQIDPRLRSLNCDVTSVRRILINLLSNAVRFSNENSEVEAKLIVEPNGELSMTVKDHGIGMKAEDVEMAFLPFHQIGGGYDRQSAGTGLGLPMVKSLAELHGAGVKIQTAPNQGTLVTVTFPADRVTVQPAASGAQVLKTQQVSVGAL